MTKDDAVLNLGNLLNAVKLLPDGANIISVEIDKTPGYSSDAKIFLYTGFDRFVADHKLTVERAPHGDSDKTSVAVYGVEIFCLVDKQEKEVNPHA